MRIVTASSCAPRALELLEDGALSGVALAHGYVLVRQPHLLEEALAITQPGAPRLPIGIEADASLEPGQSVAFLGGALVTEGCAIAAGPRWDPRPRVRYVPVARTELDCDVDVGSLVGLGPGLTPLGDDVWCGYVAGVVLLTGGPAPFELPAAGRTTTVSRSLMARARRGELPEVAHALLERGRCAPLLGWGATSGSGLLLGLSLATARCTPSTAGAAPLGPVDLDLDVGASRVRAQVELRRVRPDPAMARRSLEAIAQPRIAST